MIYETELVYKIQTLSKSLWFFLGYNLFSTAKEYSFYYTSKVFYRRILCSRLFILKLHIFCQCSLSSVPHPMQKQEMYKTNRETCVKRLTQSH